jgi:hypothetical protein
MFDHVEEGSSVTLPSTEEQTSETGRGMVGEDLVEVFFGEPSDGKNMLEEVGMFCGGQDMQAVEEQSILVREQVDTTT